MSSIAPYLLLDSGVLYQQALESIFAGASGGFHLPLTETSGTIADNARYTAAPGSELLTDGGFEVWTSSTNLTSYTESIAGTSTVNQETNGAHIHGGSNAARLDIDASNSVANIFQAVSGASVGDTHRYGVWHKNSTTGKTMRCDFGGVANSVNLSTSYAQFTTDAILTTNTTFSIFRNSAASSSIYLDDASVIKIGELDGGYNGPTLAATTCLGLPAPTFTTNDFVQLEYVRLESIFNPDLGTFICVIEMTEANLNSTNFHGFIQAGVDVNNRINLYHQAVANSLVCRVGTGGFATSAILTTTAYNKKILMAGTWSRAASRVRLYLPGQVNENVYPAAGTWSASNLDPTWTRIGSISTGSFMEGMIAQAMYVNKEITQTDYDRLLASFRAQEPNAA